MRMQRVRIRRDKLEQVKQEKLIRRIDGNHRLHLAEQLEEAKARLIEAYPQKFASARRAEEPPAPAPRPRQAPVQEPRPRRQAPPRNDGQPGLTLASISDPAERQEATESFRRFQRNMPDYTEAEYMTVYNQPHTNILDVQAKLRRKPANG